MVIWEETGNTQKEGQGGIIGHKEMGAFSPRDKDEIVCLWEIKKGEGEGI